VTDETQALADARRSGRPLLIEFHAAWCGACKLLEKHTWRDADVKREVASRFVPLRLDVTEQSDADERLQKRYRVTELPTLLRVRAGMETSRLFGYVPPAEMLRFLRE
jgi:thiol:disulfide interchange protein DsbD